MIICRAPNRSMKFDVYIFFFINTFPYTLCFVFNPGTYWNTEDSSKCKQDKPIVSFATFLKNEIFLVKSSHVK